MNTDIKDYTPYMDKYPELKLRPVTEYQEHELIQQYDYVQDLNLTGESAPNGKFYLIIKDAKMGIYLYSPGLLWDTKTIALRPEYDTIEFMYFQDKQFGAIIQQNGKFGMFFWACGIIQNDHVDIPIQYDSITKLDNGRYKAIHEGIVTYYNSFGQILK